MEYNGTMPTSFTSHLTNKQQYVQVHETMSLNQIATGGDLQGSSYLFLYTKEPK